MAHQHLWLSTIEDAWAISHWGTHRGSTLAHQHLCLSTIQDQQLRAHRGIHWVGSWDIQHDHVVLGTTTDNASESEDCVEQAIWITIWILAGSGKIWITIWILGGSGGPAIFGTPKTRTSYTYIYIYTSSGHYCRKPCNIIYVNIYIYIYMDISVYIYTYVLYVGFWGP